MSAKWTAAWLGPDTVLFILSMQNSSSSTQPIEGFAPFLFESTLLGAILMISPWMEKVYKQDGLPQCIKNSIQTLIMMQTQIRATNMRWGGTTLKSLQPCLVSMPNTTNCHNWLSRYNCQTEMWWPNLNDWKRNLCKRWPSNNWLELDEYSIALPQCINNSIRTSNYVANTNPSSQYKMRRDNLKKFTTLSCLNAKYNYLLQLTLTL